MAANRHTGGLRTKGIEKNPASGNPFISVITVVFNGAATLEQTILSVLEQNYANVEHIVIDGGSTDATPDIIRRYEGSIDYWVSEKDAGVYDAMNKGLSLATGEVVGFLNADDTYSDSSVLGQIANAFQDKTLDACYADLVYVSQDDQRVIRYWRSRDFRKGDFALGWCPAHPTFYARRSVIERLGYFDDTLKLAADAELMMRYLERWGIRSRYIPRVWVRMRLGGKTNRSLKNIIQQNREILIALARNNIPVSPLLFATNKIIDRIRQFVSGLARRYR